MFVMQRNHVYIRKANLVTMTAVAAVPVVPKTVALVVAVQEVVLVVVVILVLFRPLQIPCSPCVSHTWDGWSTESRISSFPHQTVTMDWSQRDSGTTDLIREKYAWVECKPGLSPETILLQTGNSLLLANISSLSNKCRMFTGPLKVMKESLNASLSPVGIVEVIHSNYKDQTWNPRYNIMLTSSSHL